MEREGERVRETRGGEVPTVGVLTGGGRPRAAAASVTAEAEPRSRMQTSTPATNHSGEGGFGFMAVQEG